MSKKGTIVSAIRHLVFGLALISMPLFGHHGTGGTYLMDKPPITLKGAVTEFSFVNPHVLIHFNVTDQKSAVVNWRAEGPAIINWTRAGWNRNSLKAGDQIVVTLFPSRAGKPEGVLAKLVTSSGKEWCCQSRNGSPGAGATVSATTNGVLVRRVSLTPGTVP
jgi:hypothetical protein